MTPRDRRAIGLGIAIGLGAVVGLQFVPWVIREVRSAHAELSAQVELLARRQTEVLRAGVLEDSALAIQERLVSLTPRLVGGSSEAEAVETLAGLVNLSASRTRCRIGSIEPVPDSTAAARLRRVTVRVALESDLSGILAAINGLESGDPVVAVREARIIASEPAAPGSVSEVLRAELTVQGWYLVDRNVPEGEG